MAGQWKTKSARIPFTHIKSYEITQKAKLIMVFKRRLIVRQRKTAFQNVKTIMCHLIDSNPKLVCKVEWLNGRNEKCVRMNKNSVECNQMN